MHRRRRRRRSRRSSIPLWPVSPPIRARTKICTKKQKVTDRPHFSLFFLISLYLFLFTSASFLSDIFPIIFEGFRFTVNKGLSSHFQASHALTMSSVVPSVYKFGATYIGTKQVSPFEVSFNFCSISLLLYFDSSNYTILFIYIDSRCIRSFWEISTQTAA